MLSTSFAQALPVFVQGLLLCFGLIVAIGAQNAFVLRQGLRREHVVPVVLFCALADAVLISAGVLGMAQALGRHPAFAQAMALAGALFLAWYGWQALQRARLFGPHAPPQSGSLPPGGADPAWGGPAPDRPVNDNPLIRLRGITKTYGEGNTAFQALKGVDLDIQQGDFVAIMGPSGSGKSTAMNTLGCLDVPTSGEYLFRGVHVESLSRDQRARLRRRYFGFVFQGFHLLARTSAQENVELPLVYRGEPAALRHSAALAALEKVGLKGWEHHTPGELSGGQQQRVAIARAIVTEPQVLLADEPTGNLDTQRSHEIMELLWRLNTEQGITVLMVTHEPDMAEYARRMVRFVDGVVASDVRNPVPHLLRERQPEGDSHVA